MPVASLCQGELVWENNKCGWKESESASLAGNGFFPLSSRYSKWEEDEAGSTRAGAQNSVTWCQDAGLPNLCLHFPLCTLTRRAE